MNLELSDLDPAATADKRTGNGPGGAPRRLFGSLRAHRQPLPAGPGRHDGLFPSGERHLEKGP